MMVQEIMECISIGFSQPKLYKRSVWNKAKKVMEFLSNNTDGEVIRHNFGPGREKYYATCDVNSKINEWALLYKKSLTPLVVSDALPLLEGTAKNINSKVSTRVTLDTFCNNYPNLLK